MTMAIYSDYQNLTQAEKIGLLTKSINNAIEKERNRYLAEDGLTAAQADVLRFVATAYALGVEINQVDIEKEFNLSNPTVTGILKRLEAKGFIEKRDSKKDKRYKWICATPVAEEIHRRSSSNKSRIEEYLMRGIPEAQRAQAIEALEIMLENLKELNSTDFDDE